MKKTKILLGSMSLVTLTSVIPMVTACNKQTTGELTVSLYANNGKFKDGTKTLILTGVVKGTKLKDIKDYVEPTYSNQDFAYWLDAEGNKVEENTEIKSNLMLGAYYKEVAKDPVSLKHDNWATVAAQCASMSKFVKAYLDKTFTGTEDQAKELIIAEIKKNALPSSEADKTLYKTVTITLGEDWTTDVKVRLIDVGKDKAADGSSKPLFTWEFANAIDVGVYSQLSNSHWCEYDSEGEIVNSALLRENCNKAMILKLPVAMVDAMVPTTKTTPYYDGGQKPDITTTDIMWPLTLEENGLQNSDKTTTFATQTKTYTFYTALDGKNTSDYNAKQYLGYDGNKEYVEGYKPTLNYPLWTRTCFDTNRIYMWNPDSSKNQVVYANGGWAVAPAFCF